jgi:hypothetical protein
MQVCRARAPALREVEAGHGTACFLHHAESEDERHGG